MDPPRYICTVDGPKPGGGDPKPAETSSPSIAEQPNSPAGQMDSPKPALQVSQKGIENAKKRLRAFSIQKKSPMAGVKVSSPKAGTSAPTVVIGKKPTTTKAVPKPLPKTPMVLENEELKKPKPPKPGNTITYMELKKKTLEEINDMKRKMELVELGIPLGLICPAANSPASKAMPTKAMPPIKSFLAPEQLDEIISEAKKARAEGRVFKFDYSKLLPDYDNPFLNKKKEEEMAEKMRLEAKLKDREIHVFKPMPKKEDWIKRNKEREKEKERNRERKEKSKEKLETKTKSDTDSERSDKPKETDVNLNDYLVCDSWSIDNEDKTDTSSPQVEIKNIDKEKPTEITMEDPIKQLREGLMKTKQEIEENIAIENKKEQAALLLAKKEEKDKLKIEKLKPVMDVFTYEIDVDDDEPILDMFHEDSDNDNLNKANTKVKKEPTVKDTLDSKETDYDFLESIISEIKQEVEPEGSPDKCLVAYDPSPNISASQSGTPQTVKSGSETPDLDDKARSSSRHSNYSESSYKTSESGYKTSESGYKSSESAPSGIKFKIGDNSPKIGKKDVVAKLVERDLKSRDLSVDSLKSRDKSTDSFRSVDSLNQADGDNVVQKESQVAIEESLETWSFVMKICQPLLFRHDRNKCYRETKSQPRLWFTENPKLCSCVKDRSIVYEELERCKMTLVDKLYLSDNVTELGGRIANQWYPESSGCLQLAAAVHLSSEWETEDPDPRLHQEYQRFMESVWPDIADPTAGSTTPTREDPTTAIADHTSGKHKKKRQQDELMVDRKPKKMKVASQDWSQDSEIDEQEQKCAKKKSSKVKDKSRKRKRSVSPDSSGDIEKVKTKGKKKDMKKLKAKMVKQRRLQKKYLKKLKEKQKKEKKNKKVKKEKTEVESDMETEKEIQNKLNKKKKKKVKKGKAKKRDSKKKRDSSSSDSSSSDSDSDNEQDAKKQRALKKNDAKKKKDKRKKKRKQSTSESAQSEEHTIFDVNILNNIKTEKVEEQSTKTTDIQEFSPRRQQLKPRQEIINMKELQNDLGCRSIDIKQEDASKDSPKDVANENESISSQSMVTDDGSIDKDAKENPQPVGQPIKSLVDDSNQSISQESLSVSLREQEGFEPDTSHLRPSSQNSNYSFHDVLNQRDHSNYQTNQSDYQPPKNQTDYPKNQNDYSKNQDDYSASQNDYSTSQNDYSLSQNDYSTSQSDYIKDQSDYTKDQTDYSSGHGDYKESDYEKDSEGHNEVMGNYEMYEEMAMEYQNNVASQKETSTCHPPLVDPRGSRIETVVSRGEIKCDWRAGDAVRTPGRPSRWGLKPGEANIVLTGQSDPAPADQVYPIRSVLEDSANYTERRAAKDSSYDEAYNALFGASDRLEYGDCFPLAGGAAPPSHTVRGAAPPRQSTLHQRIEHVLQTTVLGEVASAGNVEADQNKEDKGILLNKSSTESGGVGSTRAAKRVSFADGYKPGQDSDTESPPKKKRRRRTGCAWPCPASHPDHVALWDALPPPPPPPASPPPRLPPPHCPLPPHITGHHGMVMPIAAMHHHHMQKIEPMVQLPGLLADPPPGMMSNMPQLHHHIPM